MVRPNRNRYERALLIFARAVTVGAAYVTVLPFPGLTSSFVAIFASLLPFDLIVASPHPPVRLRDWQRLFVIIRPRILSTAITLLRGVAVGSLFGILAVLGLPRGAGAVLTSGLAYVWAMNAPHVISAYVAILSGLNVFERLAALEAVATVRIAQEIVEVIGVSGGGTLLALFAGWGVGVGTGTTTRLLLSRPYRSLRSAAYEPPMQKRPFDEVLRVGDKSVLVSTKVEEGSPVAHRALADCALRERWRTTVLSIRRQDQELVMPSGADVLLPGDELLLLAESDQISALHEQFRTPRRAPGAEGA